MGILFRIPGSMYMDHRILNSVENSLYKIEGNSRLLRQKSRKKLYAAALLDTTEQHTAIRLFLHYLFLHCSHCWFATLQEVLLADWQEVWHSPQPPFLADSTRFLVSKVWILFIHGTLFHRNHTNTCTCSCFCTQAQKPYTIF